MFTGEPLKIISVTGAHSRVGKTTLCSILLKALKGLGAIKFTKTPLYTSLIEDAGVLSQKGKDTAMFLESGAEKVVWVQSPYNELKNVLEMALNKMIDLKGIIVEGNSPVDFLNPHLVIFITELNGQLKPSAIKIGKKADIIIINSKKQTKKPDFLTPIIQKNAKVFWIDLRERKGELEELICFVKERISRDTHKKNCGGRKNILSCTEKNC